MTGRVGALPCGHDPEWLVELAADEDHELAPDDAAHLRACPHCTSELASLRSRWTTVRVAATSPVRIPPGLVARTVATLRAVRGGLDGRHVEVVQQGGLLRVSDQVVVLLARQVAVDLARQLGGVRVRGLAGGQDGLQLRLAIRYGLPLLEVGRRVQRTLRAALEASLGAGTPQVSVEVVDVLAPAGQPLTDL